MCVTKQNTNSGSKGEQKGDDSSFSAGQSHTGVCSPMFTSRKGEEIAQRRARPGLRAHGT